MRYFRSSLIISGGLFFWLIGPGPLNPYFKAINNTDKPQLVLVLGGDIDREHMGIKVANDMHLPLIVSGGSNPEQYWMTLNANYAEHASSHVSFFGVHLFENYGVMEGHAMK